MTSPTEISVQQLSRLIGTPHCPVIIDVRIDDDFADAPTLIPTAKRWRFDNIEALVPALLDKSVVIYCQKGLKISQGAAAILRTFSIDAETLEGGHFGWRDVGAPLVDASKIPLPEGKSHSIWVTKQRPKIDRIACPWFIRRFIDPNAQFLFVAPSQVQLVAEKFNATPFDVPDVFWTHRGDQCTFDTMLTEFGLQSDALIKMADIIRGADTNCHNLAAECEGLLAISLGLSRMYKNDLEQLDAGMLIYDALYRWARDASNERHDSSQDDKRS
ncbi:MAG: chromate resistance protein [Rhizobiaceae bacterium]|nr:chromate resistance protein [Rhizobiaceae bacterium]